MVELLEDLVFVDWLVVILMDVIVYELVVYLVVQQRWIARSLFKVGYFVLLFGIEHDHWGFLWLMIEWLCW